jgi:predicted ester cyclase
LGWSAQTLLSTVTVTSFFTIKREQYAMSTTVNQAVLAAAIDSWNRGDLAAYMEIYDDNVALHGLPPELPPGREGARLYYDSLWAGFARPRLIIQDVIAAGDKLACRFQLEATHTGDFLGIPPTGKTIQVSGMTILRFVDGRCVERWNQADMLGWLQQLGAMPTPG